MKKIIYSALVAGICAATVLPLAACGGQSTGNDKVTLFACEGTNVGDLDADYYVVPEPAASVRAKVKKLKFSGDLQQLYGGTNGYPQAVVVAKSSVVEGNSQMIETFISALRENESWITAQGTSMQTVADAVKNHLPAGTTPTFNANNLSAQVVTNCGIRFTAAMQDKQRYLNYISALGEINSMAVGQVEDSFFYQAPATPTDNVGTVEVYAPDGAPALALAKLMHEENDLGGNTVNYHVVAASTIQTFVAGNSPKADICLLPSNLASKLLGSGTAYKYLGTVTNGNLYLLSKDGETITTENISKLKGKKVAVVNLAAVPGLTFKLILKNNGIEFEQPQQ